MLCILYVNAIGGLLGVAGLLAQRALPLATASRRWIWCAVIGLTILVPSIYQAKHTSSVNHVLVHQVADSPLGRAVGAESLVAFDEALTEGVRSLNPLINQFWLIASGMLLLWGVATAARVSFLVRGARRPGRSRGPALVDGVPVVVTDSVGPATVGVLRSRVLVPEWVLALPGPQRRYVLCHEDEHRRSHDASLLFVASLTLILTPWNIALWWQLRRLRLAVEMDCDNRVVSALGDAGAYGELLFKVAQAASRGPRLQPAFLGAGLLERRLTALVAPAPLRHVQRILLPAAACVLLLIVLFMPHPVFSATP